MDRWEVYSIDWIDLAKEKDMWECSYECGYEPWGSTKCGEFLDYLITCQLLKQGSAPWSQVRSQFVSKLVTLLVIYVVICQLISCQFVVVQFLPYRCVAITNIYYDRQTQLSFY